MKFITHTSQFSQLPSLKEAERYQIYPSTNTRLCLKLAGIGHPAFQKKKRGLLKRIDLALPITPFIFLNIRDRNVNIIHFPEYLIEEISKLILIIRVAQYFQSL